MSRFRHLLLTAALLACAILGAAHAAASACPEHHAGGVAPDIVRPPLAAETREMCVEEYSVLYSGLSRTPLAAAEHLTRERIEDARGLRRENAFHEAARSARNGGDRVGEIGRRVARDDQNSQHRHRRNPP